MEAVVTFEYEAQQDDELDLKLGDVIKDVQTVDEGWCEGTLNGKRGMFPDNFVKIREPSKPPPAEIRAMPQSSKIRRAKVAFSYAADNIDELSLEPGQIVEVLAEEEEGWWRGKMGGKEGVFPSNFVEIIEEVAEPPKSATSATSSQPPPPQQSAPPPRPPSPGESAPPEPQVAKHVIGQPVMPKFDPSQALAKLKKSSNAEPPKKPAAPPPASSVSKPPPPSTTKAPPPDMSHSSSSKTIEKAKVTYEYDADNPDELTIRVGEIVEIVNKNTDNDGWWEVRLGDRVGLVPDNFVEILPASPPSTRRPSASTRTNLPPPTQPQPQEPKVKAPVIPSKPAAPTPLKKKPAPEPGKKPPKPEPHPPAPTANALTHDKDPSDFGVPSTQPLDSSALKGRPKKSSRPPSRSNLLQAMEDEGSVTPPEPAPTPAAAAPAPTPAPEKPSPAPTPDKPAAAPWQRELLEKRKKPAVPKPAPKSAVAPKPTTPSKPPITASPAKPAVHRPEPPKVQVEPKPPPSTISTIPKEPAAIPSLRRSDTPPVPAAAASSSSSTAMPPPVSTPSAASNNEWKEAFENLREEFEKFKKFMMGEIQTLTDDLDKEIKHRAALEVDIGRLKKSRGFPH